MNEAAGGYLAGRAMGKIAGRVEATNQARETIDIQAMAIGQLRDHVAEQRAILAGKVETLGFQLAYRYGVRELLQRLNAESSAIHQTVKAGGALIESDIEKLAPLFAERHLDTRTQSSALIRAGALAYLASAEAQEHIFAGTNFTAEECARMTSAIRVRIEGAF
jgi:hypothetical protein